MHNMHLSTYPVADDPRATVVLDLRLIVPASTPMIELARALGQLALAIDGAWAHRAAPGIPMGRFVIEGGRP